MDLRNKLMATLSSLALGVAQVTIAGMSPAAAQETTTLEGLVTLLADACLTEEEPGVFVPVATTIAIAQCCAIVRTVGPENADFLTALALADPGNPQDDPRLRVLDSQLVAILLSCQQDAIDRLAELALEVAPGAGTTATTTTGGVYTG